MQFVGRSILPTLILCSLVFAGCAERRELQQTQGERGKYLITAGGCHDCHTPKIPGPDGAPILDTKRLLAGHPGDQPAPVWSPSDLEKNNVAVTSNAGLTAWAGPWGVSFAMNLTPDKETGIAEWSEDMFIKVARTGKHQGQPNGRDILPPMPWFNMKDLTDDDLKAMWAYLRSIPAVKNQVPLPVLPGTPASSAQPGSKS